MPNRLVLPPYETVSEFEGKGNFAIRKYYAQPYRGFYRRKLWMIIDEFEPKRFYRTALDFGSGPACIFKNTLSRVAFSVKCIDDKETIDRRWKFDLITCASVLEFTTPETLDLLEWVLAPKGHIIIASPMDTWISNLYFWAIGDKKPRHPHGQILSEVSKRFKILTYKRWLGLYFVIKATKV